MVEEIIEKLLDDNRLNEALKKVNLIKKYRFSYFYYMAEILRMRGLIKKSLVFFKRSLALASSNEEKFKSALKIASLSRTLGDLKTARKHLAIAMKISPSSLELLMERAMYLRLSERYDDAIEIFNRLKREYIKKKDIAGISYILWAEGGMYRNMGMIKKSIRSFTNALKYAKMIKEPSLEIYSELGLAGSLRIIGKLKESYLLYSRCI
ncbi:MAG: hypothetical protein ACP5PA_06965, partial [Elusimicrobiales bacterium]